MAGFLERPERVPTCEPCTIARSDGTILRGTLHNLSNTGFGIEARGNLAENECVEVRIMGLGRLKGTIRWADGRRAGGTLDLSRLLRGNGPQLQFNPKCSSVGFSVCALRSLDDGA